ncbi:MAG: PLP-dependent aspartate aminotransferase family protein [Myxococcota bacterium]
MDGEERGLATMLVHAGERPIEGAVVTPIFQSATYLQGDAATYGDVVYLRLNNSPQQVALGAKLAAIEGAEAALPLASGMAAISTALLSVLSAGDHVLVQRNVYGGTATLLAQDLPRLGITHTAVDAAAPDTWAEALRPNTRAIYVESVSNPLLDVPDLPAVVRFARERGLVSFIDNTFQSPAGFRPVPFGFDLVLHSATKFLNGHSDLVAGVIAGSRERVDAARHLANHLGGSLDPHACFLLDRGLKTLTLRLARQTDTAMRIAMLLAEHPKVRRVRYPGLPADPNHERARAVFDHFGAMLAFELDSGEAAARFLARVTVPVHAVSLGGVESLVVQPARSTHLGMAPEARAALGISDALVRVSVGVEDPDDLLADFARALEAV